MKFLCEICRTELDLNYDPKIDTKDNITELLITPCKKCTERVQNGAYQSGMRSQRSYDFAERTGQRMGL